jgi:DNA-binding SARP family transcriptional activator/predicted ATPase
VPTLQIQLLGDFRLLYNDEPISMAHLVRQQSLLAYLVMHRDSPQSRQHLAFMFWPDASEAQARANLRKALYDLRKILPSLEHFVQIEAQFLRWRNSVTTILDVDLFDASLTRAKQANQPQDAQAALEQAVALYTGDLLPTCYDDWLLLERERLRQHYVMALEQLISLLEQQRELPSALTYAQRLLHSDPLHESAYRLLMRLHVLNGDRATALRTYHTCVTLLQQELGADPSAETQQLYQRLLNAPTDPEAQSNSMLPAAKGMLPLVGRQPEWKALQSAWRTANAGSAHCVLIAGEAGIGKTRLAEELLQWAERQGYATARTRSYATEGRLAYAPIIGWLRSDAIRSRLAELDQVWLVEVARLLPELLVERSDLPPPTPLSDSWQRQRFREALARAILLGLQPLLLVIDDLQWCDSETLEWIRYLLRLAAHEPLLIVGTVRSEEVGDDHPLTSLLMDLRQAGQLTDIELGPLSSAETTALATQIVGVPLDHDQAALLYAQTEGHPLFVVEMLRASENKGTTSQQAYGPASRSLPPKVKAVIQSRLAQLSMTARELAGLAATVGRAFSVEVLARASDGNEESLVRALDELWQRRLIREQGDSGYDFSHDRIREAAYASVSAAGRRLFHRRVAQALEQIHATDLSAIRGELAAHYDLAGLPHQAIVYYQQAADAAQRIYAHTEASSYLARALELLKNLPATTDRLQQELKLRLALAISLNVLKGQADSGLREEYARAYELAIQVGSSLDLYAALFGLFLHNLTRAQLQVAHELAEQRHALAMQIGAPSRYAETCGSLGVVHFHRGQWTASRTFLEQALDRASDHLFYSAKKLPVQHHPLAFHRHLAVALWHLGYPDQALEQMNEVIARAEKLAHPYTSVSVYSWRTWLHHFRREVSLVQIQAERAMALCLEYGMHFWHVHNFIFRGWAVAQQGQVDTGITEIRKGLEAMESMEYRIHKPALLGLLADAYGRADKLHLGLHVLHEALTTVGVSGERFSESELYRLKGELLLMQGTDRAEIESHLLQSLTIARQQEAKSLELRAALTLSKLWKQQDKHQEAHALLAPIYDWFTEGFDTRDLVEARAFLEELS